MGRFIQDNIKDILKPSKCMKNLERKFKFLNLMIFNLNVNSLVVI